MLVKLLFQAELRPGQKLEKEVNGRKVLVVRHPTNGSVSVMDAHCFHMGHPLVEGDIEDVGGHTCVVCPAHRYRIDISNGHQVDRDLFKNICASSDQKQRVYRVQYDDENIWVDLPDTGAEPPLPSDVYNQCEARLHNGSRGLLGPQSMALPGHYQPNAEVAPNLAAIHPRGQQSNDPHIIFSQEAPRSPEFIAPPPSQLPFPAAPRPANSAFLAAAARRRAATQAILKRGYKPPTVETVTPVASGVVPAPTRQATLYESWNMRAVATGGANAMDAD